MPVLDLNIADGPNLPSLADLREKLRDQMEDLFRAQWGDPVHPGARDWRPRSDDARSMVMRGPKRGGWTDHKAGTSGGPLEFFATYCLGWDGFPQDQDGKRILRTEVARWLGIDVSTPVSAAELERKDAAGSRLVPPDPGHFNA